MHAYAMSNDFIQATELLEMLESSEVDSGLVTTATYDGYILACVRCDQWTSIKPTFDKMIRSGITGAPSSVATHGLLLASRRSDKLVPKEIVQELLDCNAIFSEEAALVTARILLPDLCSNSPSLSTASLCDKLRSISVEADEDRILVKELHRLLRIAMIDSSRDVQKTPQIWNNAVEAMQKISVSAIVVNGND